MAGEQKGKAYEAFTKVALDSLRSKRSVRGDIFWGEKPEGMTIIPDLTVGKDKDHPLVNILISHGGSAKESNRKYWRNCGELAECKIFLDNVPKVFSLFFDAIVKDDIKKAGQSTFDGEVFIGDRDYGPALQKWIDDNLGRFPKDKDDKVKFIKDEAKSDKSLQTLVSALKEDLKKLLAKKAPIELEQVWSMERKRLAGKAPRARDTFVRRGLSRLLIFEDIEVAIRLFTGKRVGVEEIPSYAYDLGLATRFTGGGKGIAKPADEEIANAIATIGDKATRSIVARAPIDKVSAWLTSLRNIGNLVELRRYMVSNYSMLSTKIGFLKAIKKLHAEPGSLANCRKLTGGAPDVVWLFELAMEVIKQGEDKASGYGYAQLGREVVEAGYGSAGDLSSANQFGGGFGLSAWLKRNPKSGFRNDLLEGCADVVATRLSTLGVVTVIALLDSIKEGFVSNIIESKLCTYKGFEPLRLLIEDTVRRTTREHVRSCFGEKAELGGHHEFNLSRLYGSSL